jgi:hypothetical protein
MITMLKKKNKFIFIFFLCYIKNSI